ncbi:MAG: RNA-binding transcriptional accessory protein [Cyanobacterium sp. T60_A2020_053]|nr:RNA-binding transcriptional accessory protein [Cyanobacterium sp. T60_A2020_053]
MFDIAAIIAHELNINLHSIKASLELLQEGCTIPFIARYRKERTSSLNEIQLRAIADRFAYLQELEQRKQFIIDAIASQNKLHDSLKLQIEACLLKNDLEDLYLPYKPKRRSRATSALQRGLNPLAEWLKIQNNPKSQGLSVIKEAQKYLSEEVQTVEDAVTGAGDIIAEEIAENAQFRAYIREFLGKNSLIIAKIKKDYPEGTTKYEMYRNFSIDLTKIAPHNLLALFRGENEKIISFDLDFDQEEIINYLIYKIIKTKDKSIREIYQNIIEDSFKRLLKPSLIREIRSEKKAWADQESIKTFEANLRQLLLSPPAGMQPTMGIDPGFRTGCKVAIVSETGQFLDYTTIFPHTGAEKRAISANTIKNLIQKHNIKLIAIGNGTAGRETDEFISALLRDLASPPVKVMVNESGASIYSASDVAIAEFPNLDLTVRGAVSIARRLQDPLAELVKIDPKSIGVGQYQHDVDQKLLQEKLSQTVESCVNYVGVDLNTASPQLLVFVSGINPTIANNIVNYRDQKGAFKTRKELLKVSKLGAKTFEQCAGFLRIRDGQNPLDNTAVHPESYPIVAEIAQDLNLPLKQIDKISPLIKNIPLERYINDQIGLPTLQDIVSELAKPGRDPRAEFSYASFRDDIKEISDLKEGMILEGVVTNVVNFGAFVDIGVHQDGLVHISQLADRFVQDTTEVVKVGEVIKVRILEVNEKLKRISLSRKDINPIV